MSRRNSRWTSIYWGPAPNKPGLHPFIRFTPTFMDLEAAGFPHGIGLAHTSFDTEEEAIRVADTLDKFFEAMAIDFQDDIADEKG